MGDGVEIARLMRLRDHFTRAADWAMCREVDAQLARYGIRIVDDDTPRYESVVPPVVKRGPGRPRKETTSGS